MYLFTCTAYILVNYFILLLHGNLFLNSGFIGQSWAMLFASVGYQVYIYDSSPGQVSICYYKNKYPQLFSSYF